MKKNFSELDIFRDLDLEAVKRIVSMGFTKYYFNGDKILEEGKKNGQFHIILSGIVKVVKGDSEKGKILGFLNPGEFYGEMSLILNKEHTASIFAKGDAEILVFLEDEFKQYFLSSKTILNNLLVKIAERLSIMDIEVINLAYSTIQHRLMNFLWYLTDRGSKTADIKLTHNEIAQMIGTNRETITKLLNELKTRGTIKLTSDKKINILKKEEFTDL